MPSRAQGVGEDLRRVALLAGQEVGLAAGDDHLAAQAREGLRQLAAERAAADHQQPPRALGQVEDRFVGQIAGFCEARRWRGARRASRWR